MSELFEITASLGSYSVLIESGAFTQQLSIQSGDVLVVDDFFRQVLPSSASSARAVLFYAANESVKSLDQVPGVIEQMRRSGANRQSELLAIGGGIIQDLSAFAASIYMRGIGWTYYPTTILGMVDSCIGGKSSINVGPYKNLVGTYHPPQRVVVDPQFALTLPVADQASGLVEAAKICMCRGQAAIEAYLTYDPHPDMDTAALGKLISLSLMAKKWFIETDEFDENERLLLNFGHTFGHAIEGASDFKVAHGIAVGLGILCALTYWRQVPEHASGDPYACTDFVLKFERHIRKLIERVPSLPSVLSDVELDAVMERFESDKKHKADRFTLILVEADGAVCLKGVPRTPESRNRIREAVKSVLESISR